jgi:deoxyribodipyrimidine photo-lyase
MLKSTVKRGLMLDFISDEIIEAYEINPNRIAQINTKFPLEGEIVYFMSREFRIEDNWALLFALQLAEKNNCSLKVIISANNNFYSKAQEQFFLKGLNFLKKNLILNNIQFEISKELPKNPAALIIDFNPLEINKIYKNSHFPVYEVDSHNIIPARFISNKQEFSAATLRRKVYANIAEFLTEFPRVFNVKQSHAYNILQEFIQNKLKFYAELKNNPNEDVTSNLSPYINFGFISAQRVAIEVIKSDISRENKEAFLEELIVRKELADNFCLYSKNYKTLDSCPIWARESLNEHKDDIRNYIYNLQQFESSQTHDELWNTIQTNLVKKGKIHGYLRMYWAKKILEWAKNPDEALNIAIYLNDNYALDGKNPNGYVGILWSICGLHDRAFSNRLVTGKIRYMSFAGCIKKFDLNKYINKGKD